MQLVHVLLSPNNNPLPYRPSPSLNEQKFLPMKCFLFLYFIDNSIFLKYSHLLCSIETFWKDIFIYKTQRPLSTQHSLHLHRSVLKEQERRKDVHLGMCCSSIIQSPGLRNTMNSHITQSLYWKFVL